MGSQIGLTLAVALIGYALGCFNTGYHLVRWRTGQDLRTLGSGNAGARNAGRILGKTGFVQVFLGDALKGVLAVGLARAWGLADWGQMVVVLAVVAGHLWPIQLGGQGGKGASTAHSPVSKAAHPRVDGSPQPVRLTPVRPVEGSICSTMPGFGTPGRDSIRTGTKA